LCISINELKKEMATVYKFVYHYRQMEILLHKLPNLHAADRFRESKIHYADPLVPLGLNEVKITENIISIAILYKTGNNHYHIFELEIEIWQSV